MGFKDLFIASDESDKKQNTEAKAETKFPSQAPNTSKGITTFPSSTPVTTPSFGQIDNEHLSKFTEMYQNGFDSLNQQGYDFYEFYTAIINSGGIDNPQMYQMAMSMGTGMDKTNSKNKLLSSADYYLNEIAKVYNQYVTTGNSKKQDLVNQKNSENQSLNNDLSNLRSQLEAITNQIKSKESQLSLIDNKYQPLISDIDNKLVANDVAKNNIINNITKVRNGINNNIN